MPGNRDLKAFSYLTAERHELYSRIMNTIMWRKRSFALHLRIEDIRESLLANHPDMKVGDLELEQALRQLHEWGAINIYNDRADVQTIKEFESKRYLYQIAEAGEAVVYAVEQFHKHLTRPAELQAAALQDIISLLSEFGPLTRSRPPDGHKLSINLSNICRLFNELTIKSQSFLSSLRRSIELTEENTDFFLKYKQVLVDYLERFISELVSSKGNIARLIEGIDSSDLEKAFEATVDRELVDALDVTPQMRLDSLEQWRNRWEGLKSWFVDRQLSGPTYSEQLRAKARQAIPDFLTALNAINESRVSRMDRARDFTVLAQWFAEADSNKDCRALWQACFGLYPSRHFYVNSESLACWEKQRLNHRRSWKEFEPLEIWTRLRETGSYSRRGRQPAVPDRRAAKEKLQHLRLAEERALARAKRYLIPGRFYRFSKLPLLTQSELLFMLDLLGSVLGSKFPGSEETEADSSDGQYRICYRPVNPPEFVTLETEAGRLSTRDFMIKITDLDILLSGPKKVYQEEVSDHE